MSGISWEHFLRDIKAIQKISLHLNDNWETVFVVRFDKYLTILFSPIFCKNIFKNFRMMKWAVRIL